MTDSLSGIFFSGFMLGIMLAVLVWLSYNMGKQEAEGLR